MEVRLKVKLTRLTTMGGGVGGVETLCSPKTEMELWQLAYYIIAALHVCGFNFDISPSSGTSFF